MPTDNQQENQEQNKKLESGETVNRSATDPKDDCCERILDRLNSGLPVILTQGTADATGQPGFEELKFLTGFIRDLAIDFNEYKRLMDSILNTALMGESFIGHSGAKASAISGTSASVAAIKRSLVIDDNEKIMLGNPLFSTTHAYRLLKYATEKYLRSHFGLRDIPQTIGETLPYIALVESKLEAIFTEVDGVRKVVHYRPVLLELIWSYWHEEGMVVQTINAIAKRFQNIRAGLRDPLGNLEIHPLRPLNNILWGYIQDTVNRLTVLRRSYEYNHHYGIALANASNIAPADSRSYFIQSFHNLLNRCALFYREADNLTRVADAIPVLNALREVHLQLAEGAHNQFGDLPLTSRVEMLVEQYMLSRPEIREFLGGRVMVPSDQPWMDIVDTMKAMQGWNRASSTYFHDLAVFGEQILLSIRWISWTQINNRNIARAWALDLRDDIQRYIHCYQAVTGVDLSATNVAGASNLRSVMPSVLIKRKRELDMRRR